MKLEFQKVYTDIPDFASQEYNDLNHFTDNNQNNSLTDLCDEISIFEILKLIENPDEHINTELPAILENLIMSKKLDDTNSNNILIADLSRILIQHLKWMKCFPQIKPYYKVSSNNNPELMKILKKLGINFACSEKSEIENVFNIENFDFNHMNNFSCNPNNINNNSINNSLIDNINKNNSNLNLYKNQNNQHIDNRINNPPLKTEILSFLTSSNIPNNKYQQFHHSSNHENSVPSSKIIIRKKSSHKKNSENIINDSIFSENMIKYASEKNINNFICSNIDEILTIKGIIPNAKILLRINVDTESQITRSEKKRIINIFCEAEELEITENINGLSLEVPQYEKDNNNGYLISKNIYELFKRAREIFDEAEEYGIEMKVFDIGSPENENFFNEENIKLFSESLDYFFSDLHIEFIAQLGKFFSASAFTLVIRNPFKSFGLNENSQIEPIYINNNQISSQHSSSSANLVGLNSTEISSNINVSAINPNSTYYYDLDFLPLEENMNLGITASEENQNINFNKNFPEEFILNNSAIIDSQNNNNKELNVNLNNDCTLADNINLNTFICPTQNQENNEIIFEKDLCVNIIKENIENSPHFLKNEKYSPEKNEEKVRKKSQNCEGSDNPCKSSKKISFDEEYKENMKKYNCEMKNCIQGKIENLISNNRQEFHDWFVYENIGDYEVCKSCDLSGFSKPEIYYISNRISIKLEKYFYVIMNKFDS